MLKEKEHFMEMLMIVLWPEKVNHLGVVFLQGINLTLHRLKKVCVFLDVDGGMLLQEKKEVQF